MLQTIKSCKIIINTSYSWDEEDDNFLHTGNACFEEEVVGVHSLGSQTQTNSYYRAGNERGKERKFIGEEAICPL